MTSGREDEEFFRQRGFGIKIGFGERPALIVIDMIKGFTNPDMPLGAPLESQLAAQTPLIDVAHERKIPVGTMEQRIGPSKKLGRQATVEDRLAFGRQLATAMGEAVLGP